ncbi:MAG: SHOCT domain-containing protein [Coriobacteriia bacterium]
MMRGYGYGYGTGGYGAGGPDWLYMGAMMLFILLAVAGVVLLLLWALRRSAHGAQAGSAPGPGTSADGAFAIARERFARGEITAEEFEALKRGLGY